MRLLQSVLATLPQTRKPQRKFITHLLGLVLMLPGHATFRNLSRYSSCHERTFARWYDRPFDFVSLNKAAITQVIAPEHQQALVIDASFIPKSGTRTYGLEHFRNSRHRRSEKGLEVSAVAWLDIADNCACGLSVEQTPPSDKTSEPQGTRIDACLEQLRGVVCDHHLKHLRHVIADGYYSKRKFLDGVRALGLHQIGKLRRDANLRYFYQGLGHPGPGRPKTHDGKVQWDDLSRFERVQSEDDDVVLYHQVLNHVHLRRNLRVVLVVDTRTQRRAVLFSTDTDLDAQTLYRGYKARFQIEFLFRDAKQFTSLSACQARSQAKLHFHFNASMSALPLGKLEARQQSGNAQAGFSMASLKRRAFNQHLPERISQHLAQGQSLEKSSPDYQDLCNYGTITDRAACILSEVLLSKNIRNHRMSDGYDIEFFWDPVCPFAWITSRWVEKVAAQTGYRVDWRFISLRLLNKHKDYATDFPPDYEHLHGAGLRMLRVAAKVRAELGRERMGSLYEAYGQAYWEQEKGSGMRQRLGTAAHISDTLAAAGLPTTFAAAADDTGWDAELEAETELALSRTGRDVGTPIITFEPPDGLSFFGPVISRVPSDADAVTLWNAVVTLARFPGFAELKRSLREVPQLRLLGALSDAPEQEDWQGGHRANALSNTGNKDKVKE